jgi:hypothetical protein
VIWTKDEIEHVIEQYSEPMATALRQLITYAENASMNFVGGGAQFPSGSFTQKIAGQDIGVWHIYAKSESDAEVAINFATLAKQDPELAATLFRKLLENQTLTAWLESKGVRPDSLNSKFPELAVSELADEAVLETLIAGLDGSVLKLL